jgi:hypothetical protein
VATRNDIQEWIGDRFLLRQKRVDRTKWKDPAWRALYLARRGLVELYYVHDEPAPGNQQLISFATPNEA